jgi:hypothetical protein
VLLQCHPHKVVNVFDSNAVLLEHPQEDLLDLRHDAVVDASVQKYPQKAARLQLLSDYVLDCNGLLQHLAEVSQADQTLPDVATARQLKIHVEPGVLEQRQMLRRPEAKLIVNLKKESGLAVRSGSAEFFADYRQTMNCSADRLLEIVLFADKRRDYLNQRRVDVELPGRNAVVQKHAL